MKWEHICSLEWMQERQRFLCASDVRKLVPVTKTGRPRKITDLDRLAIWGEKQRILTIDDCMSTGTAARGHELEAYAIEEFNNYAAQRGWPVHLDHWDDVVVNIKGYSTNLAYSPDAMNVAQPIGTVLSHNDGKADTIGEVKSYSTERHLTALATPKMELEERWQIATAFAADPNLQYAWLIFYNPSLRENSLGIFDFDRALLQDEIDQVRVVSSEWTDFLKRAESMLKSGDAFLAEVNQNEIEIINEFESTARLNP